MSNLFIDIKLFPIQEDFLYSEKKFVVLGSGTGFGKTWVLAPTGIIKAFAKPGLPVLALGPSIKHLKRNLWGNYLLKFLRLEPPYCNVYIEETDTYEDFANHNLVEGVDWILNKSDMTITFPSVGSVIQGAGFNEPNSFQGIHAGTILADELGIPKEYEALQVIRQRINFRKNAQLFAATTPYNWGPLKTDLYDPWVNARDNGTLDECDIDYYQVKSIDNPFYSKEHYYSEEKKLPKWKFDMLYNGMFTRPAGLVYKKYNLIHVKDYPFDPRGDMRGWFVTGGVDFGYNAPTAIVWVAENLKTKKKYIFDEHIERKMDLDKIEAILRKRRCTYYGDAASAGDIATLANHGIDIRSADKGPGSVEAGIRLLDTEFRTNELNVLDCCEYIQKELGLYSYQLDANGEPIDKIVKDNDHELDALRYNRYSQREAIKEPGYIPVGKPRLSKRVMERFNRR